MLTVMRLFRALERVDTGLTPQQYRILKLAGAGEERSARLAERLAVAKPTLTATADGLVAAGYVQRKELPGDRRVVRLCLTAAGRSALERADAAYADWLAGCSRRPAPRPGRSRRCSPSTRRWTSGAGPGWPRPEDRHEGPRTAGDAAGDATGASAGPRPRAQDAWLRRLAGYCWRHRRLEIMALGGSLVATLVQAIIPLIMAWIVDSTILVHRHPIWLGARCSSWPGCSASPASTSGGTGAGSCRLTSSTRCAPSCSSRCRGWTGPARTSCTPARSSAAPSPT